MKSNNSINREKHEKLMEGSSTYTFTSLIKSNPLKTSIGLTVGLILILCSFFLIRIWLKKVAKQKQKKISVHPEIL